MNLNQKHKPKLGAGVYAIRFQNGIKIGMSSQIERRLLDYNRPWNQPVIAGIWYKADHEEQASAIEQFLLQNLKIETGCSSFEWVTDVSLLYIEKLISCFLVIEKEKDIRYRSDNLKVYRESKPFSTEAERAQIILDFTSDNNLESVFLSMVSGPQQLEIAKNWVTISGTPIRLCVPGMPWSYNTFPYEILQKAGISLEYYR